jgi:hypothetical protein
VAGVAVAALIGLMPLRAGAADFTRYHNHEELTAALQEIVNRHPNLAKLVEIGKSLEGRSIWAVEIANPSGAAVETRPGLFIAANFEGDRLFGSELALYAVDYLLGAYETNGEVKRTLDEHVVYVVPRANPDAAELMFAAVKFARKTNNRSADDDNDGRTDEDGPEDLNGDGVISVMRVKDPGGEFMIHPEESRLMKKADPKEGEAGAYKIYWEGIDNDKDGFINEDPAGGVDLNRNFQHQYPYYQPDAGPHMVSEPESRAIMDYVLKHRNIALILTFGESDNLITAPTSRGELGPASSIDLITFARDSVSAARQVGMFQSPRPQGFRFRMGGFQPQEASQPQGRRRQDRQPETRIHSQDLFYFQKVSETYRELTDIASASTTRTPGGAFFQYGYFQFGVPSFSTPGWGLPAPSRGPGGQGAATRPPRQGSTAPRTAPPQGMGQRRVMPQRGGAGVSTAGASSSAGDAGFDLRLLRWMDAEGIDGFTDWTPYEHPTLGEAEIGGFHPYAVANPPAERIALLGQKHCNFILQLTTLFPKVSIAETSVTSHGGGVFRIKAEIENSGFLPTSMAHGITSRSVKPTMVQLGVDPDDIISGSAKTSFFQTLDGSGRRQKYEWIVRGTPGATVTLKVVAQKGGTDTATLTLK